MKGFVCFILFIFTCQGCIRLREPYPGFPNTPYNHVFCPYGTELPVAENQYWYEKLAYFRQGTLYSIYTCPDYDGFTMRPNGTEWGLKECFEIGDLFSCGNVAEIFRGNRVIGTGSRGAGITRVAGTETWVYYSGGGPVGAPGWPLCN